MAAVSDRYGHIQWFATEELQVWEVDGRGIGEYFYQFDEQAAAGKVINTSITDETCPACQFRVSADSVECPSCGLTLISSDDSA